jgi:hypothetical protein
LPSNETIPAASSVLPYDLLPASAPGTLSSRSIVMPQFNNHVSSHLNNSNTNSSNLVDLFGSYYYSLLAYSSMLGSNSNTSERSICSSKRKLSERETINENVASEQNPFEVDIKDNYRLEESPQESTICCDEDEQETVDESINIEDAPLCKYFHESKEDIVLSKSNNNTRKQEKYLSFSVEAILSTK